MRTTFMGYRRPDGTVGIRNHLLIIPTSSHANQAAQRIARLVGGAVALQHPHGTHQLGADLEQTFQVLVGTGAHPNVGAAVVVGLGFEGIDPEELAAEIQRSGRPVAAVSADRVGGTVRAIEQGTELARQLRQLLEGAQREPVPVSELILGTNCGGSDTTSGMAANPALGACVDLLIEAGGTAILSETTELIGAEHILAERCISPEVRARLLGIIERFEKAVWAMGHDMLGGNPSPGNIAGGLTTIEEKSLGCIAKGGTTPVMGVVDYAERPGGRGLWVMDTPGNDIESVSGMVAGGCQVVIFTTGRGTPTGNPVAPVIKVTANPRTAQRMRDNIDLDLSPILSGEKSVAEMGAELYDLMLAVADGQETKAEILGHREFSINRIGISV